MNDTVAESGQPVYFLKVDSDIGFVELICSLEHDTRVEGQLEAIATNRLRVYLQFHRLVQWEGFSELLKVLFCSSNSTALSKPQRGGRRALILFFAL